MMDNDDGEGGEVAVRGMATTFTDPRLLADIDEVNTTTYEKGEPIRGRWRA